MRNSDLTRSLISQDDSNNILLNFFPESIILSPQLDIVEAGSHFAKTLGYQSKDLQNKSIEILSYKSSLSKTLTRALTNGFFTSISVLLKGKESVLECRISGFYLGLISESSNKILVKVRFRNQVVNLHDQLEKSRDELDEFVYRTAHDLRGPLATIRGLVNLMKLERPEGEMAKFVDMVESQANKLNDRLYNLNYLSEFAFTTSVESNLDCATLESQLRCTIEANIPIDNIDFQFISQKRFIKGVNAQLVISLVNHLILYLLNLSTNSAVRLVISITETKNDSLNITISSEGFLTNYQLREAINQKTPVYTNIIAYSKLINFFAAQKAAERMEAAIKFHFTHDIHQQINIQVPIT